MKRKKWLSLFMAVALLVSGLPQTGSIAAASAVTVSEEEEQLPAETEVSEKEQSPEDSENPEETEEQDSEKTIDEEKAQLPTEQESGEEEQTPEESGSEEEVQTPAETEDKEEEQAPDETEDKEEEQTPTETEGEEEVQAPAETEGEEEAQTPTETEGEEEAQTPAETEDKEEQAPTETEDKEEEQAPTETESEEEKQTPEETEGEEEAQVPTETGSTEEVQDSTELEEELLEDIETEEGVEAYSLLPLTEVRASLMLNDYSEKDLKAVPVETVLKLLRDKDGNPIEIAPDASLVWSYYKDEEGYRINDEYHVISRNDTVDLSYVYEDDTHYTFELIVGSGKQLDADSIRYIITVYINAIEENMSYDVYRTKNSSDNRREVRADKTISAASSILSDSGIPVTEVSYYISSYDEISEEEEAYYLGISSSIASNPNRSNIKVDVYPMQKFLDYHQKKAVLEGAITDQILNQEDLSESGGYAGTYGELDSANPLASDNIFCIVYTDANTGAVLAYQGLIFIIRAESIGQIKGGFFAYENGKMKAVTDTYSLSTDNINWSIDQKAEANAGTAKYGDGYLSYKLKDGYGTDKEYYYVLEPNDRISKVFAGYYDTLEEAEKAKAKDITSQILPSNTSKTPYGYKINVTQHEYDGGVDIEIGAGFTIVLTGGAALKYYVHTGNYSHNSSLWFDMDGAEGYDYSDIYRVKSDIDTYYRNGFQTLLINDANADLTKLVPVFSLTKGAKAYVGTEQISGESVQDFSEGTVEYKAVLGDDSRNYWVTFVKKEHGAKLFVNGPEKREIFLTERYSNRHDILIANVGDAQLTGLKVELVNPSHVKLDDYWTVGGEKNDTLAAFDTAYSDAVYGELPNLAKIRLLPDGDGVISGKLKISADGQAPVYIELTGYAGNPKITTENLSTGVKYVPYSYMIATNNMYEWNQETFSIEEGTLPKGLQLYPATGEIYGVPQETGKFPIKVKASFSREEFDSAYADLVLTVKKNTNKNVYTASDAGYEVKEHIGEETKKGSRDFVLTESGDQLFVSSGEFGEFIAFWMNGEKLVEGKDYTKEKGSTKITVREQTLKNKASGKGTNTIAAEFRVDGSTDNELKRTAQNFRMDIGGGGSSSDKENNSGGSNSGNGGSSDETDISSAGAQGSTVGNTADYISLIVRLIDTASNPLADMTVELHSTPKTARTNQNGIAVFTGVESGHHTLFVKDQNGNILASREFDLQFGTAAMIQGNQITAVKGSSLTLDVQAGENGLTFFSAQNGDVYQVLPTGTGDESNPVLWMILAFAACAMGFLVLLHIRKKKKVL